MTRQSAVDIVFQDLSDALDLLRQSRSSPTEVRKAFNRFVELSQKLTSAMRKEFKKINGQKWNAFSFDGWDKITEFFKKLRNVDQHEATIRIQVHARQYYPVGMEGNIFLVCKGTWELDDQLSNRPPEGMKLVPTDPDTGGPSETEIFIKERQEYDFHMDQSTAPLDEMLTSIEARDTHFLSEQCFKILKDYNLFYSRKIKSLERN